MSTIVLAGGNEFRKDCIPMDRELLKAIANPTPRVVVVPTAAARENPSLAAAHGVRYFESLGAVATTANVIDRASANDPLRVDAMREADAIYFVGGNPWYLLETLRDSLLVATIRTLFEGGRVIAGSSAGAMALAERMVTNDWSGWIPSVGLATGVGVLPHHDRAETTRVRRLRDAADRGMTILGIDEATACIGAGNGTWRVAGAGGVTVYTSDRVDRYVHGDSFQVS